MIISIYFLATLSYNAPQYQPKDRRYGRQLPELEPYRTDANMRQVSRHDRRAPT
jgi:hypothetical protein